MTINLNQNQTGGAIKTSPISFRNHVSAEVPLGNDTREVMDSVIAVFADHQAAEVAIRKLAEDGFEIDHLSIIGKGYHSEEKVVGFYNVGERVKFWGARGAFWGGLWGLFFGGLFITTPAVGPVIVLGYLASIVISTVEGALVVGGTSALAAALYSVGVPKNSVIEYESDIKADRFLIVAHGAPNEVERAKSILGITSPYRLALHARSRAIETLSNSNTPVKG